MNIKKPAAGLKPKTPAAAISAQASALGATPQDHGLRGMHKSVADEVARLAVVVARYEGALGEDDLDANDGAPAPREDEESADALGVSLGEGIAMLAGDDDDPVASGIAMLAGDDDPLGEGVALLSGSEHAEEGHHDGDEHEESALSEETETHEDGLIAKLGRLVTAIGIALGYLEAGFAVLSGADTGLQQARGGALDVPQLDGATELRRAASPTAGAHASADEAGAE